MTSARRSASVAGPAGRTGSGDGLASGSGLVLPAVLVVMLVVALLLAGIAAIVTARLDQGSDLQGRIDQVQLESDAVRYAANAVRNDNTIGRQGTSSSWTYSEVTVTCTGETGSGVVSGAGRTDRTVTCTSTKVRARYRFFDRSGAGNGTIMEQLSWSVAP